MNKERRSYSLEDKLLALNIHIKAQNTPNITNIEIDSKILNQERSILIYTPELYNENTLVNYDVIYVLDSQSRAIFNLVHSLVQFVSPNSRYIVVGITSPYSKELNYSRNNDFLPEPINVDRNDFFGGYCCNSNNFKRYILEELIPYIDSNFRTSKQKLLVGHSLGASFSIDFMLSHNIFDAYFAISPNFAYDKEQLAKIITNYNFDKLNKNIFLYISEANEDWNGWRDAWLKTEAFLQNNKNIPNNIHIETQNFPDDDHWEVYPIALRSGLKHYFEYSNSLETILSNDEHIINIKVKVPNSNDSVYITGNQTSLGDWDPSKIKLNRTSDFIREIKLSVKTPTAIQLTRGSWDSKAIVKNTYDGENIIIDPSQKDQFEFEIIDWFDSE